MGILLLVNGPPASGKTTLAQRLLDERPLALLVDIDALRMSLGQWREIENSKREARRLALALIDAHLGQGLDVVVPQYLGRTELIEALDALATKHRVRFVEVVLEDDQEQIVRRFAERRDALAQSGELHPQGDVSADDLAAAASDWCERVDAIRAARPATRSIDVRGGIDAAFAALSAVLDELGAAEPGTAEPERPAT